MEYPTCLTHVWTIEITVYYIIYIPSLLHELYILDAESKSFGSAWTDDSEYVVFGLCGYWDREGADIVIKGIDGSYFYIIPEDSGLTTLKGSAHPGSVLQTECICVSVGRVGGCVGLSSVGL
jgi:hypothetical protein